MVLASGTLAPLESCAGELRLPFHVQLEAPHVVDMRRQVGGRPDIVMHLSCMRARARARARTHTHTHTHTVLRQVWAGVLPNGPDGHLLNGTFASVNTVGALGTDVRSVTAARPRMAAGLQSD